MKKYAICLFILISTMFIPVSPTLAQVKTLAITPFTITSETGLDYLETGLIDLFSSRLALKGKVQIADKARVIDLFNQLKASPQSLIPEIAGQTQADYVLTGSLEESSKGLEIHVFVLDPARQDPVLDLKETSGEFETNDVIIPLVDAISAKINRDLFSRQLPRETEPRQEDVPFDIHAHPDKLLEFVPMDKKN